MAFEIFEKRTTIAGAEPRISIKKQNSIGLNEAAAAMLGKAVHVHLYFDREARLIGIKPVTGAEADRNAYVVHNIAQGKGRYIYASAFLKYCGLAAGSYRAFDARMDAKTGLIMFEVDHPLATGPKGGRARA